jgi:DNA-binding response OmpR family regulator
MGNILIADDDKNSRDSIQKVLEKEGHQVESAEDVDSALSALHRSRFDLVVCDYRMPGKSGADLLVELRKRRCSVPVLMISAHADDEAEESFREFGAMGLLRKPIRRRDLVLQTARVCGG